MGRSPGQNPKMSPNEPKPPTIDTVIVQETLAGSTIIVSHMKVSFVDIWPGDFVYLPPFYPHVLEMKNNLAYHWFM